MFTRKRRTGLFVITWSALISANFLLTACFSENDALEAAANRPNGFPPAQNAEDDFTANSTGDDSSSAELEPGQIRVTLEVPAALAPAGEKTRRNLRLVEPDTLTVYQTDQTLRPLDFPSVRIQREDDLRSIITFNDGLPLGPDVIIEANYNGQRFRSLAADADRNVKINPFSEYLAAEVLGSYTADELNQVMRCVNDSNGLLCLNKYVWGTLADQVHDFEITIPDTLNLQQAVAFLGERGDFASYVSSMADYALLGQESSGKVSASSADYNTVFWAAELGQTFRESSLADSGQWGVRSAAEKTVSDANGTGYFYPGMTLTNFDVFDIRVTSLASDVPYNRETLIHTANNEFYERNGWELNTHASSPGAATLEDDSRLLAGRALYQSISGRGASQTIGWTRNPYYLDAFTSTPTDTNTPDEADRPDRVVGGYFTAGKAIELVSENRQLKRERTLEEHSLSVLEINLLRAEDFAIGTLDGRNYNVVYLSALMNECSPVVCPAEVMVIESGVGDWAVSDRTVNQTMRSRSVRRDQNGGVTSRAPDDNPGLRDAGWLISERPSRVFSAGEGQIQKSVGRLSLDRDTFTDPESSPQVGTGASTPDGTLMAFNIDTITLGNGLLIAAEAATTPRPKAGRFRLQGVGMAMAADRNRLAHFDNAVLTLDSDSRAELTLSQLDVVHQVNAESVSTPAATEASGPVSLVYSGNGAGAVSFTATDFALRGFFTADQTQFYLQVRQSTADDELLGLVMATLIPE